jgi:FMN phosphatase YigB (HAD superfamily)
MRAVWIHTGTEQNVVMPDSIIHSILDLPDLVARLSRER